MSPKAGCLGTAAVLGAASAYDVGNTLSGGYRRVPGTTRWRYRVTYPSWSQLAVSKFIDMDADTDPACDRVPAWPIDWPGVRGRVRGYILLLQQLEQAEQHEAEVKRNLMVAYDINSKRDIIWRSASEELDTDIRYSSHRNDCYFGALAFNLCEHIRQMHRFAQDQIDSWFLHWHKLQLELEALLFYFAVPWSRILRARWHIPSLLSRLSQVVRAQAGDERSSCDLADSPADTELLLSADPETGLIPVHVAEPFVADHGHLDDLWSIGSKHDGRCPFGLVAAVISLAIWMQAGVAKPSRSNPVWASMTAEKLLDSFVLPLLHTWEAQSAQFFFDTMVSHWRLWLLFEHMDEEWTYQHDARDALFTQSRALSSQEMRPARRHRPLRVLFIGGGVSTFRWTSFTQRARQLSKGLRLAGPKLGANARAWNAGCLLWCQLPPEKTWVPAAIVHVKTVCRCALAQWRHVVHVYDPVDVTSFRDSLGSDRYLLRLDALLVTTSLALKDMRNHPALLAAGNVSVYWLPLHHSNFHGVRSREAHAPVKTVGMHTVHEDQSVIRLMSESLRKLTGDDVRFLHLSPYTLFRETEGRVMTPQQTAKVYTQLSVLDVGVVKQSGCSSEWWFCSRWRTGQRLANHMSVGLPVIVYRDAQGHLDVLQSRWSSRPSLSTTSCYPRELVVAGDVEVPGALRALLHNETLRVAARRCGLRLAARLSLQRVATSLARLLQRLVRRRKRRTPRWRRGKPGLNWKVGYWLGT